MAPLLYKSSCETLKHCFKLAMKKCETKLRPVLMPLGIFLFTTASRTALRPTQPPIQWVPGGQAAGARS
jgi:hypothetical protein